MSNFSTPESRMGFLSFRNSTPLCMFSPLCRWEALIMICAYALYIVLMYFNTYFSDKAAHWLHPERYKETDTTSLIHQGSDVTAYGASAEHDVKDESTFVEGPDDSQEGKNDNSSNANCFIRSDKSDRKWIIQMNRAQIKSPNSFDIPKIQTWSFCGNKIVIVVWGIRLPTNWFQTCQPNLIICEIWKHFMKFDALLFFTFRSLSHVAFKLLVEQLRLTNTQRVNDRSQTVIV